MFSSAASATFGLSALATPTRVNVTQTQRVGKEVAIIEYQSVDSPYACSGLIAAGSSFVVDLADNDTSASDSWTAGTAQVETATAAGTITASGNAQVVVTAAGMTGSPKTLSVPVLIYDTAAEWAAKIRAALAADEDVSALFSISGSGESIIQTRLPLYSVGDTDFYPADDTTLNISLDNGTCTGITTAASSANTTPGVATSGVFVSSGSSEDFEGNTLPTLTKICGILIEIVSGNDVTISSAAGLVALDSVAASSNILLDFSDTGKSPDVITIDSTGSAALVRVTVLGGTA